MARLADIKARAEKATPGPWYIKLNPVTVCILDSHYNYITENVRQLPAQEANTNFIAHAREDIPYLLSLLEDVAASGVESDGARNYVTVQIDRAVWEALTAR